MSQRQGKCVWWGGGRAHSLNIFEDAGGVNDDVSASRAPLNLLGVPATNRVQL